MVIQMGQNRTGTNAPPIGLRSEDYEDEILNAGWNPAVPYLINDVARCSRTPEQPEEQSAMDVDAFLDRVYALATQI